MKSDGVEALYEFDVNDMPVAVALDASGASVHGAGRMNGAAKVGKIPVVVA